MLCYHCKNYNCLNGKNIFLLISIPNQKMYSNNQSFVFYNDFRVLYEACYNKLYLSFEPLSIIHDSLLLVTFCLL